jgi:hypothetical protein
VSADPVALLVGFLRAGLPDLPAEAITGDLVSREAGEVTIYLTHSGGFRVVRDRMDRWDVEYDVYHPDRSAAVSLALECRDLLLRALPGLVVAGVEVLDVEEISTPIYLPDTTSREHVYGGEVTLFLVA